MSSLAGTPEIEANDFRQDMIDANSPSTSSSFWGRTFGALTTGLLNNSNNSKRTTNEAASSSPIAAASSVPSASAASGGIPLNAYLTYVTLKLNSIMSGNLSIITFLNILF